jgi:hypothetical protein
MATGVTTRSTVPSPALKLDCTPAADDDGSAVISSALKKISSQFLTVVVPYMMVFWVPIVYGNMSSPKFGHPEEGGSTFLRDVK